MKKIFAAGVIASLSLAFLLSGGFEAGAGGKDKGKDPAFTISEVMKKAMKGGLCGKVASGKASDAEVKELVDLFTALAANKAPKGEEASWKAKTGALLEGAKAAAKGDKEAGGLLKKAANCKACHEAHKG